MTVTIDKNTWLYKWFEFNTRNKTSWWKNDVDICQFRRVCFVTGPLKWLTILGISIYALFMVIVMPIVEFGWLPVLAFVAGLLVFIAIMATIFYGIATITHKAVVSEAFQSWKGKWCSKVEFVEKEIT